METFRRKTLVVAVAALVGVMTALTGGCASDWKTDTGPDKFMYAQLPT